MRAFQDTVILVFAKAPIEGTVNTRLVPDIGVKAATQLQDELIHQRLSMLDSAGLCDVVLMCAPDTAHPCFESCVQHYDITLQQQIGDDLGVRILNGMSDALQHYRYCIVIGTDAPALGEDSIRQAINRVRDEDGVIFVPAEDGGYVLVAVARVIDELFTGIEWGTPSVLQQSVARLETLGLSFSLLDGSWDVDRLEDYQRYMAMKK